MNLLLNLKIHSLVKERLSPGASAFGLGISRQISRRTRVSRPLASSPNHMGRRSITAADSFEFGKMSIGNSDSFQASCPSVSVTGSASDLEMFKGALSEAA